MSPIRLPHFRRASAFLLTLACCLTVAPVRGAGTPAGRTPIYDESADAKKLVDDAVARAATDNKRVLIQVGGNWCGWC